MRRRSKIHKNICISEMYIKLKKRYGAFEDYTSDIICWTNKDVFIDNKLPYNEFNRRWKIFCFIIFRYKFRSSKKATRYLASLNHK